MSPDLWEQVKRAFEEISESGPQDRERLLRSLTDEVRSEVERMLGGCGGPEPGSTRSIFPGSQLIAEIIRDTHSFELGQVLLNRFEIRRFLGSGGMGEVYAAFDRKLGDVALKTLRLELTTVSSTIESFRREVMRGRQVSHPNVCRIYDLFETDDAPALPFFTMQLLSGQTLAAFVADHGPMPEQAALPVAMQLCQGLQAAHDAGVIHGDFKSGNVIVEEEPGGSRRARITDFGLARLAPWAEEPGAQAAEVIAGTRAYLASELLSGEAPSVASDVFALGVVLYYMRTGRYPFDPEAPQESAMDLREYPPAARDLTGIGPSWAKAIAACLATAPGDRPGNATAVMRLLTDAGGGRPFITRRRLLAIAGVAGTGLAVEMFRKSRATAPGLPPGRLKTLIEDFDCPAGPPAVARAVRNLLVLSLTASKRTDVVTASEVQRILESTGLGAQSVRGATAKAAAVRTGARIIVGGEVRTEDSGYRVSIHAEDAVSGRGVLPAQELSVAAVDLPGAVSKLSDTLRRRLGEEVILAQFGTTVPEQIDTARADALESFTLGLSFYNAGEPEAALAKLTEATRLDPDFAVAYMYQALIRYAFEQNNLALGPSEKAYKLRHRLNSHSQLYAEYLHLRLLGDTEAAHAKLATLAQFFPDDPNLNRHLSASFELIEKPEQAFEYARKAAQLDPDNPLNTMVYASGLAEVGRPAEADQVLRAALERSPESPPLLFCASWLAMYRLDEAAALGGLDKILNRGGPAILSRNLRIRALILAGRLEEAVQRMESELPGKELADEVPTSDQYRYWLGQIAAVRGDAATSGRLAVLLSSKEAVPASLLALRMAAELAWLSGRPDVLTTVIAKLQEIERIHSGTRSAGYLQFAQALAESVRGRPVEALNRMQTALALWPDLATRWAMGELLLEQRSAAEAVVRFREVANAKASALQFEGINTWIRSLARVAACLEESRDANAAALYRGQFERIWGSPAQYHFGRMPANPRTSA